MKFPPPSHKRGDRNKRTVPLHYIGTDYVTLCLIELVALDNTNIIIHGKEVRNANQLG